MHDAAYGVAGEGVQRVEASAEVIDVEPEGCEDVLGMTRGRGCEHEHCGTGNMKYRVWTGERETERAAE